MATSLPLARGFFNAAAARPSEDQRRQYIEFAESSIRKVFALSDCHRNSWIPVREKKGVAVFRNFGSARGVQAHKSNIAEVGGKGDVQASLDEIARAYAAHDDALFSRLMKKLNGAVMDAAVVTTIVPRSPLAPFRYIGIKWFAVKTPTPLVSHRDYCCLEVQDKIVDAYGNEMYIRILNSIEIKECPSLENSHGLVRAKMLAGYMYRTDRAEPTVVRIHHVARFDPAGYFPSQWAYKTAESQLVSSVVQIKRVVEKQQMNACTFVDKKQWVPNHERQHCAVCSRHFGTFRPRHHCRCCGEVICGKCSIFKSVDVPGTTLKNVRICSICNMGVQKARGPNDNDPNQLDDAMSDISTSSVTSSSTIAHNEMNLMDLYLSGPPGTPSAYSTASAQSNLSMRSTTSTRSVITDGRAHRGNSGGGGGTPGTARFFKGGNGSTRGGGYSIFSSSTRGAGATFTSSTTPAGRLAHNGSGGLFNDTNTPRSYLGGGITPHRLPIHGGIPQGFGGTNSAASTPRGTAFSAGDPHEAEEHEHRKSVFKQNPLDLAYLRESVRVARTDTTSTTMTNTNDDGDESMQGDDAEEPVPVTVEEVESTTNDDVVAETETEAVSVPDEAMTATTTTDDVALVTKTVAVTTTPMEDSVIAAPATVVDSVCDVTTTTMAVTIPATAESQVEEEEATPTPATATAAVSADASPAGVSTTPRRLRGESGALVLPPAKMARVEDGDVEMEDATSDSQQDTEAQPVPEPEALPVSELVAETASEEPVAADETNQDAVVAATAAAKIDERSNFADDFVVTFNGVFDDAVKPMDVEMEDDDVIRSSANSTSTTESSTATAAAVQPLSVTQETPRKSFLGGLFSRSSSESKSSTA